MADRENKKKLKINDKRRNFEEETPGPVQDPMAPLADKINDHYKDAMKYWQPLEERRQKFIKLMQQGPVIIFRDPQHIDNIIRESINQAYRDMDAEEYAEDHPWENPPEGHLFKTDIKWVHKDPVRGEVAITRDDVTNLKIELYRKDSDKRFFKF